jgi:nucleotide-binding universal stress UspA family protein
MSKRIFVAIDNSSTSKKALDEAINLAKALGAELCIGTAVDEGPIAQHGLGLGTYIDIHKVEQEMRDAANALIDQAAATAEAAGCKPYRTLMESEKKRVAEMILEAATRWDADLIVLGTHGRRGFERFLMGSVAENLVRIATTSLLLVRET